MNEFSWQVRVYYEDTDAGGVVYYANYLKFMERARTEWLRALGFEQDVLRDQGYLFVVRHVTIDYLHPARFNQQLKVISRLESLRRVAMVFDQKLYCGETCLARARIKIACLDANRFKPVALPTNVLEELQRVG